MLDFFRLKNTVSAYRIRVYDFSQPIFLDSFSNFMKEKGVIFPVFKVRKAAFFSATKTI
jgi:hypothetical protein